MELYLFDLDDPASASKVINSTLGENTQSALALAAKNADDVSEEELLTVSHFYRDLAGHTSLAGKSVLSPMPSLILIAGSPDMTKRMRTASKWPPKPMPSSLSW